MTDGQVYWVYVGVACVPWLGFTSAVSRLKRRRPFDYEKGR